jgi:hypothetical protein
LDILINEVIQIADIQVRALKNTEFQKWDELVENSPIGTIFHSSDWLIFSAGFAGKKLKIYGCFRNERLVGGCSLYISRRFFNMASSTGKMTPFGGILLGESSSKNVREKETIYNNIIRSLCDAIDAEHFDHIEFINAPDFLDTRPFIWNGWASKILYTYYLDLNMDFEKNISKDARWTINKAIKNNIVIKKLNDPSIFYDIFSMTSMRQGFDSAMSEKFFKDVFNIFQGKSEMWVAETKTGEIAASEIILYDNKRAYRWAAASHTELRKTGAPSLLLYEIFRASITKGIKQINLMAANTPQLAKFISGFNPILVPYYSVEKSSIKYKIIINTYNILKIAKNR